MDEFRDIRIVVGINTCEANRARLERMQGGWLRTLEESCEILYFYQDTFEGADSGSVRLPVPGGYQYLDQKTCAMIRYMSQREDFDYFIKLDDDVFIDQPERFLKALCRGDHSGRNITWNGKQFIWGPVYALSRGAILTLDALDDAPILKYGPDEDLMLTRAVQELTDLEQRAVSGIYFPRDYFKALMHRVFRGYFAFAQLDDGEADFLNSRQAQRKSVLVPFFFYLLRSFFGRTN
ncbi:hypothetical protein DDZ13_06650 [Coraliomargarita sinensis]|uniref:Hexosyltransferase n=1 Tax=Coraliomargarita sinensis TaxID=2174842 RepID=A0A317ZF71_9BACT|nr:hypothetical protein [Coraliomargarita sinensis]PXA04214.1 hypothetical protein DDZ13_06650 [Coraliomargarita sinensis]